jgi:DNA-binding MurR/RpiR family transcriptional regulator
VSHVSLWRRVLSETTTIRVSRKTLESLERLREKLDAENLDEAIQTLIRKQRKMIVEAAFGVDEGKIKPFTEEDRGEDRR